MFENYCSTPRVCIGLERPLGSRETEVLLRSGHTKDFKNSIRSFRARRSPQAEVRRILCMCCSSFMSLNSVQSFVIDNCNGRPIENGLNNVCLHPLSRTFTFTPRVSSLAIMSFHIVLVRGRTKYCLLL